MPTQSPKSSRQNDAAVIRRKMARLRDGGSVRTLDLFAGCGGLSLGFAAAGFNIVAGVENDALAAESHHLNFFGNDEAGTLDGKAPIDITEVSPDRLVEVLKLGRTTASAIDVIIGGPPCQAFARVGRAKLREIDQHPEAFLRDPRADLYLCYLQYVRAMHPLALVMENVPDALNYGGHNICEEMCDVLSTEGYRCGYTLLNSAFYGVPQMRERVFLFAIRRELGNAVVPPPPTHFVKLPAGYEGTRAVALKSLGFKNGSSRSLFDEPHYFATSPESDPSLPPAITAREATADLPPIMGHLDGSIRRGARRFDEPVDYSQQGKSLNAYCRLMRNWPDLGSPDQIFDHVIRSLPRDYQIFREMRPGDQYPQAHELANRLFKKAVQKARRAGRSLREGSAEYRDLEKSIVPPYDPGKFPNKWRKMEADSPARTLLAHLGKDSYSHIHYDSRQARTISVREAARLQSFPDGFRFVGTMNPAFRQIGNAVPPLLANAVAHTIASALGVSPARPPLSASLLDG